jgi:ribosomal protein S18 acetylase RimI-like enzyme
MRDVRLRGGRADDGRAMASVFGAARAEMLYLPHLHTKAEDVAFFSGRVLPRSRVTVAEVVAEFDGDPGPEAVGEEPGFVGFSAVREGWLDHLYVNPAHQGVGIGSALLGHAMRESPEGLTLWVFAANHRAITLYARAGFVEVRRTDGSANEEHEPDVQMRWPGRVGRRG